MVSKYQLFFYFALFVPSLMAFPKSPLFDPIDLCIMACDDCYKNDAVLECANECISTKGQVGPNWSATCPRLYLYYEITRNE